MAFDEGIAQRLRDELADVPGISERRMFGGLAMLLHGKLCCGVIGERLMLRVGVEDYDDTLTLPHVSEMDFTGTPMRGFVYVAPEAFEDDMELKAWLTQGLESVRRLSSGR